MQKIAFWTPAKGQVGVEAAAYVHVEKHAVLNCGRLGPVDGGLDVGHDSGIGHKLGEVASDGSNGTRVGCHPSRCTLHQTLKSDATKILTCARSAQRSTLCVPRRYIV